MNAYDESKHTGRIIGDYIISTTIGHGSSGNILQYTLLHKSI